MGLFIGRNFNFPAVLFCVKTGDFEHQDAIPFFWSGEVTEKNSSPLHERISLWNLLQRPEINLDDYQRHNLFDCKDEQVVEQLQIQSKYEGYIHKMYCSG